MQPGPVVHGLPVGWTAHVPKPADVPLVVGLLREHRAAIGAPTGVDLESVEAELVGPASWTRRQVVVRDPTVALAGWVCVHDRAAGRTIVEFVLHPQAQDTDQVAAALLRWVDRAGADVIRERDRPGTRLDATVHSADEPRQRWLTVAGYERARVWRQMIRPVQPHEADLATPKGPDVRVRTVATHEDGMPVADDLRTVHTVLEESFVDHFNSYRESLAEFLQRLREYPGHRWDQWWLAEVQIDGRWLPGGAIVGSVLPENTDGFEGSYVEYLGVHERARGRGVAKALLGAVIADAARRGRDRVGLEVDAQNPSRADALYEAMGWRTECDTESWHKELDDR